MLQVAFAILSGKEAYNGKCKYTNYRNGKATTAYRDLNEFQTFIRYPVASEIVKKSKRRWRIKHWIKWFPAENHLDLQQQQSQ